MKHFCRLLVVLFFFCTNTYAQEQTNSKFGKGVLNVISKDSSWSMKFAPRIQFRANSSWDHDGDNYGSPEQNILIRRARLKFSGFAYSPKLKYKIELGLSNRDISGGNQFNRNTPRIILDAVVMWNFYENFELWAGQTKLPGNVERVVSSGNLQLIDRSLLNSRFNIDRDVGFQLRHHTKLSENVIMREKIAVSQGEGRNITEGNQGGLQYTGRLELLPLGEFEGSGEDYKQSDLKRQSTPKLMLGATYDYNNNAVKTRSNLGSYMFRTDGSLFETDITTTFVDAMFKYKGFSLMAEYANREADNPVAIDVDGTETGDVVLTGNSFNFQAGYLLKSNYEIAGRFTTANFDAITGGNEQKQYTLGVSKYIVGHNLKIQSDLSFNSINGEKDNILYRIGFDLHF